MWCTVGVSVYTPRRLPGDEISGKRESLIWISDVNTTQFSTIVELRIFDSPLLLLRFDASDISFQISGHNLSGLEVVCFLVSLSPAHVCPSGGFSFKKVNLTILDPASAFQ